jgi:hypothetical protein
VYNYNKYKTINYPLYEISINSLIKGYFSLYFNNRFTQSRYISSKNKIKSLNKIFVSKAEIKHTNSKAIITIYVYNREKIILEKKIRRLNTSLMYLIFFQKKLLNRKLFNNNRNYLHNFILFFNSKPSTYITKNNFNYSKFRLILNRICFKINLLLRNIRRFKLRLNLNEYKFQEDKLLYNLNKDISEYYGKKVEFNIVNIKSITHNTDIFTQIFTAKVKRPRIHAIRSLNSVLDRVKIEQDDNIKERARVEHNIDFHSVENLHDSLNINSILKVNSLVKDSLGKFLHSLQRDATSVDRHPDFISTLGHNNVELSAEKLSYLKLRDLYINNIKYKRIGGVKLVAKGRLTRRFRADRAQYKLK